MQNRHFDRRQPLMATLLRLAFETVLLGVLACYSSAFLAVRRLQTDGQSRLVQSVGHAAQTIGLVQLAEIGVLLAECFQSLSQSGIWAVSSPSLNRTIVSFSYFVSLLI